MPTYYTYEREVPLLPGQTLGFAAGKGYHAKGAPEPLSEHGRGQEGPPAKLISGEPIVATPAGATVLTKPVATQPARVASSPTAPSVPPPEATAGPGYACQIPLSVRRQRCSRWERDPSSRYPMPQAEEHTHLHRQGSAS